MVRAERRMFFCLLGFCENPRESAILPVEKWFLALKKRRNPVLLFYLIEIIDLNLKVDASYCLLCKLLVRFSTFFMTG